MTFNIGSQTGGVVNNVAGDQLIGGNQQGILVTSAQARQAVLDLRSALGAVPLDEHTASQARARVDEIDAEVKASQPDRSKVAGSLERLTRMLVAAGSLTTAGGALLGPLQSLASWLGSLGEPILRLLPAFG
ncbi:MAG: hypothetical protein H0T91_02435 [Propionibacteriaceae bacterium]|nr:hypothetical protein [Propionibacteriaceae bacterium]